MEYRESYEEWLRNPYFDEATKEELRSIGDDDNEIKERFYRELEFGTAGLRGVIGAGTNRMNIYTVRKATQGLANYIIKNNGQEKGVAIALIPFAARQRAASSANSGDMRRESRHIFSNLCVRLRSCPMQSEGLDVLQVLISPPVITRRSIMATRYTGRMAPRSLRLTTKGSWMR